MNRTPYITWYDFKKDLQKQIGRSVLNQEWLQLKPEKPLPWDDYCMRVILSKLSSTGKKSHRSRHSA